jgi:hypothetical protein
MDSPFSTFCGNRQIDFVIGGSLGLDVGIIKQADFSSYRLFEQGKSEDNESHQGSLQDECCRYE